MLVMSFSSSAGICIFLVHCRDSEVKWKLDIIGNVLVLACINKETLGIGCWHIKQSKTIFQQTVRYVNLRLFAVS